MLGLDEEGKRTRKPCRADFVLEAAGTFVVCTAEGGYVRRGADLNCLKAQKKSNNFINRQDFQMLSAVSKPKSGKGFFLKKNMNSEEPVC